jgi:AraC-like DNA-binding protein
MPVLECGSLLFYNFLIFRIVGLNQNSKNRIDRFLFQYSILFSGFTLSYISYYILFYAGILKLEYDYAISLSMASIIYFIGYRGYFLPVISEPGILLNEKYEKSGLTESAVRFYAGKLIILMTREKLFIRSDLKLGDLADKLKISVHNVSQVINSSFEQSFYDFINGFRIEEAIRMMNSNDHINESLIGIAYSCGFNNKVSFNNAFRKFTGISPGKYRKLKPQEKLLKDRTRYRPVEVL